MIPVTKPFLPPLNEYSIELEKIWKSNILTNMGPLHLEFEKKLKDYFKIQNLHFVNNGTIALQIAIKSMDIQGEIITTPFSYVATTSSIVWENCIPIFVDINPKNLNIDPNIIESRINSKTKAIIIVHMAGLPCQITQIRKISKKYKLILIEDCAHSVGTKYNNKHVGNFGTFGCFSFYPTKQITTGEGGMLITNNKIFYK